MSQIVLYYFHSSLVLSFYIHVTLHFLYTAAVSAAAAAAAAAADDDDDEISMPPQRWERIQKYPNISLLFPETFTPLKG